MKLRILHVKGGRPLSGVGTFMYNYFENIDRNQVCFDFLLNEEDVEEEFDEKVKRLGGTVYIMPSLYNMPSYKKQLKSFYKENAKKYDIIQVHSPNIAMLNFYYAKKYGIETRILHSHNTAYSDKKMKSIRNYFLQIPIKYQATHYVACGKKAGKFLFKNRSFTIMKNAIDLDKSRAIKKQFQNDKKIVIGHIGHFVPQKNHRFIIEIARKLKDKTNNFIILLVGEGLLKEKIQTLARQNNLLENFIFLGMRSDIYEIINAIDIFILPSLYEGLPLVSIEVQSMGVAILASDKITKEIKINKNVYFLPINDAKQWTEKIITTNKEIDRSCIKSINEAGYNIKMESQKMLDYYKHIIRNQ